MAKEPSLYPTALDTEFLTDRASGDTITSSAYDILESAVSAIEVKLGVNITGVANSISAVNLSATSITAATLKGTTITATTLSGTNVYATTVTASIVSGTQLCAGTAANFLVNATGNLYANAGYFGTTWITDPTIIATNVRATTVTATTISATTFSGAYLVIASGTSAASSLPFYVKDSAGNNLIAVGCGAANSASAGTLYVPGGDILNVRNIQGGWTAYGTNNLDIAAGDGGANRGNVVINWDCGNGLEVCNGLCADKFTVNKDGDGLICASLPTWHSTNLSATTFSGTNIYATTVTATTVTATTISGTVYQGVPYLTWTAVTDTTVTMSANNGYIANNAGIVSATMPASAGVGAVIEIVGYGAGMWRIIQQAGQTIHFGVGDTTTGATGYLSASLAHDCVRLMCVATSTNYVVVGAMGNLVVA